MTESKKILDKKTEMKIKKAIVLGSGALKI